MIRKLREFLQNRSGNFAVTLAVLSVPVMGAGGAALDYTNLHRNIAKLQNAADSAALASTRELGLANTRTEVVQQVAANYVQTALGDSVSKNDLTITTTTDYSIPEVKVSLSLKWQPLMLHYLNSAVLPLIVDASARLHGGAPICMLGLDEKKSNTIHLVKRASIRAQGCGIYSNSDHKHSIKIEQQAKLDATVTCSAGGYNLFKKASFNPDPITDCPRVPDPLSGRQVPTVGNCDYTKIKLDSGVHTLYPGTYCEGLKIKGTAKVTLNPGIYILKGDKLEVTDNASLSGKNVGFYLHGNNAKIEFKKQTTIDLTAPKNGLLAGLLIFEDRTSTSFEKHEITSDNARNLLGTIYLANGVLKIDSEAPVADQSAYTAIIAKRIELDEGPTLVLNSDFNATDVPVPAGLVKNRAILVE